jgi:hypothetical protein
MMRVSDQDDFTQQSIVTALCYTFIVNKHMAEWCTHQALSLVLGPRGEWGRYLKRL